jgi:hypothetical protein
MNNIINDPQVSVNTRIPEICKMFVETGWKDLDYGWEANVLLYSMLIIWFLFQIYEPMLKYLLPPRWRKRYNEELDIPKRVNVRLYLNYLVVGTAVTVWIGYLTIRVYARKEGLGKYVEDLKTCVVLLCALYLFDLVARVDFRWSLIMHHLATLAFGIFIIQRFTVPLIELGLIYFGFAVLEQPSFLALLMYRLHGPSRLVSVLMYFAAVSFAITRIANDVIACVYFGFHAKEMKWYDILVFWIFAALVLIAQVYSVYVQFCLARHMWKKANTKIDLESAGTNTEVEKSKPTFVADIHYPYDGAPVMPSSLY